MRYQIPYELINEHHVFISYRKDEEKLAVYFSRSLNNELATWPRNKVKDLVHDINTTLDTFHLFEPHTDEEMAQIYHSVFVDLHQVY